MIQEVCPLCSSKMEIKNGRYGYFWSCMCFPKCKGTKNIGELYNLDLCNINFNDTNFINEINHELELSGKKFYIDLQNLDEILNKNELVQIFEFLMKKEKRFLLNRLAYEIYNKTGILENKYYYFLNRLYKEGSLESIIKHKEYQIQNAIVENWNKSIFCNNFNYTLIGKEVPISSVNCKRVDILAKTSDDNYVIIEVKSPTQKGINAWGQLYQYSRVLEKETNKKVYLYIVAKGFIDGVEDEYIGLIGYTIENNLLALIPWKKAKEFI